jgi:hypothetical protein
VRASGKVNLIGVVLLAGIAGGIYWLIFFAPLYLDNMDVKTAVVSAYNDSGRISDEKLKVKIKEAAAQIATHKEDDGYGTIKEVKGLGLTDEQIVILRNEVAKTISIRVDYDREVQLKPLKKMKRVHFSPNTSGPALDH